MTEPFITVIITAHNRKEFITKAILSVLNQDLEREKFEVLIVKNFNDIEIDNFIKIENLSNIYTESVSLGKKLALGVKKSKGKVISFLEDDDLWTRDKLMAVMEHFTEDPSIGYYKHSIAFIDKDGIELSPSSSFRFPSKLDAFNKFDNYNVSKILSLLKTGAGYHLSSMSIRRDILLNFISVIESTNIGLDLLMLFFAIETKSISMTDSRALCFYRLHNSSSNDLQNYNTFIASKQKLFSGALESMLTAIDYFKLDSLKLVILDIIANYKFYYSLITLDDNITVLERLKSLKFSIRVRDITGLLVFALFIPQVGRRKRPLGDLFRRIYFLMLREFYRGLGII